jgi:UDP-glucose 4-epimerase
VVGIFIKCAIEGQAMPVFGDGQQSRSFSYIDPVAQCIAAAPFVPAAQNQTFNVGGDESMTVLELAEMVATIMNVSPTIQFLPSRQEVMHAHCRHDNVRRVFPEAYANAVGIREGLERMAASLASRSIPPVTECPAPIEIADRLPPSWAKRLAL